MGGLDGGRGGRGKKGRDGWEGGMDGRDGRGIVNSYEWEGGREKGREDREGEGKRRNRVNVRVTDH